MLNGENKELCYQVLQEYGTEAQMLMVIEECSELQKAICKSFRSHTNEPVKEVDSAILEEMVDVIVMCEQLRLLACVSMEDVNEIAKRKLIRALGRTNNVQI